MKDNNEFGEKTRYDMRRKRNMNRILNISIVVVGGLILFFAAQLFFTGEDQASEEDQMNDSQEETEPANEEDSIAGPDNQPDNENTNVENETNEQDAQQEESQNENSNETSEDEQQDEESNNESDVGDPTGEGKWEPVGTEQSGAYQPDFSKGSQNWNEMENALQYATGLNENNMIIWWLENGGGNVAIGTVSDHQNQSRPYEVTMEFVENEGWKPTKVEVLDSNPYR
ncbi:YrrS family protein [Alteribacillus iranensis]|uniref:DUF1510 domain-containing protein n=1 Tax=Alteribacillus iranensis TaxID=930128 RepID=A0A1I1Z7Z8_9BACI|nr:YrrS family protein [Alteribacillus iranensis]SFE27896.1 Protein of unknown function [Alteribacillus iranensis]